MIVDQLFAKTTLYKDVDSQACMIAESVLLEDPVYRKWAHAGTVLNEAALTTHQINQIFQYAEKIQTAGGDNRTMVGKGKDAAGAVGDAWKDLKSKIYNSKPMGNFAAQYNKAAEKLKQATGGDAGAMKYINKYRKFAEEHPMLQSAVYAALVAAAGISGAGLGGAAVLGLFKLVDQAIQGKDIRSAAWSGLKTGGMAYAAGQIGQALKGGDAVTGADSAAPAIPTDLSAIRQQASREAMKAVQDAIANGTNPNQLVELEDVAQAVLEKYSTLQGGPLSVQTAETLSAKIAMQAAASAGGLKESTDLTESQIYLIVGNVVTRYNRQVNEGIMDTIKGAAGKAVDWAKTKGTNLTTKLTADKLLQAWKKAGSPTDSLDVAKIIQNAGVPSATIKQVYNNMKIPFAGEPGAGALTTRTIDVDPRSKAPGYSTTSPSLELMKKATASLQGGPALSSQELKQVNNYRTSKGAKPIPTAPAQNTPQVKTPAAPTSSVEIPIASGVVNPATGKVWLPSELRAAQAQQDAAQVQPTPTTTTTRTGGKVAGQTSMTPNAIRKREARAKAATANTAGAAAFGQMSNSLANAPVTKPSTITPTAAVKPSTPASTTLPTATSATAPAPSSTTTNFAKTGFTGYKLPGTTTTPTVPNLTQSPAKVKPLAKQEPITIGGQKIKPTDPAYAKIMKNAPAVAESVEQAHEKIAVADIVKQVIHQIKLAETKDDLKKIKQSIDRQFSKYGLVSESAFVKRDILVKKANARLARILK